MKMYKEDGWRWTLCWDIAITPTSKQWKDGYVGILIDETIDGYGGMTDNADKDADASLQLDV